MDQRRTWGALSPAQCLAIHPYVKGKRVRDLGCGNLQLSGILLSLGAKHVTAIDAHPFTVPRAFKKRITFLETLFKECRTSTTPAFISWPANYTNLLTRLVIDARVVIYLGKNYDGTGCGEYAFWRHVIQRKVLVHIPERKNTLIIYGCFGRWDQGNQLLPEELGGLDRVRCYDFQELYGGRRLKLPKRVRDKIPEGITSVNRYE